MAKTLEITAQVRKVPLLVLLAAFYMAWCPAARADDPEPPAEFISELTGTTRNKIWRVAIFGPKNDGSTKYSGTKCEFAIHVTVRDVANYSGPDHAWATGRITSASLKIGGETIPVWPDPPPENLTTFHKPIRFASTHFSDGSTQSIELKASFAFAWSETDLRTGVVTGDSLAIADRTATANASIYNKGQTIPNLPQSLFRS
jgi:hypothetical protein